MIRRMFAILLAEVMLCMLLTSCATNGIPTGDSTTPLSSSMPGISETDTPALPNDRGSIEPVIPDALKEIPSEYFSAADEQGTLVELHYDTWESKTYEQKTTKLTKRAIVYLPYGYDESKEYNTFYYKDYIAKTTQLRGFSAFRGLNFIRKTVNHLRAFEGLERAFLILQRFFHRAMERCEHFSFLIGSMKLLGLSWTPHY